MKIELNGLAADIPIDLKDTVYFVDGDNISSGKVRRIHCDIEMNTGYFNIIISLQVIVFSKGRERSLDLGLFSKTRDKAYESTERRFARVTKRSGLTYHRPKHGYRDHLRAPWTL